MSAIAAEIPRLGLSKYLMLGTALVAGFLLVVRSPGITDGGAVECAVETENVPDGPDPWGGCFPGESNTGPSGDYSSVYGGSCSITTPGTTITSKTVNCDITVSGSGTLTITNSLVNGYVQNADGGSGNDITIADSIIDANALQAPGAAGYRNVKAVGHHDFTILRSEIRDSNGLVYCGENGTIQDSYLHGIDLRDPDTLDHASALRVEHDCTVTHNSLHCDYTGPFNNSDIGCSANVTQYPQFGPNHDNEFTYNLYVANTVGNAYCAYGGNSGGPYNGDPLNRTNLNWSHNRFQKGTTGSQLCGAFGPIGDFAYGPSITWTDNLWDDETSFDPTAY